MDIDTIVRRGQSGEALNVMEIAALMHHAISLLTYSDNKFIETSEGLSGQLSSAYRYQQIDQLPLN